MQSAIHSGPKAVGQRRSALALPSSKEGWLKDALISLSIANLCFMFAWVQVGNLAGEPSARYYETHAPEIGLVWALVVDIILLGIGLFLAFRLRRTTVSSARWTGTAVIIFFCAYGIYALQRSLQPFLDQFLPYGVELVLKGLLIAVALVAIATVRARALRFVRNAFLVLSPLFLVMLGNTTWMYATNDLRKVGSGRAAGMLPGSAHTNRVIWIIFDELDDRILFEARPARIHPKEFDRLRSESIYAGHVKTPAGDTAESIPGLFIGRTVARTDQDTSKLFIRGEHDSGWTNFASQPNVFRRARDQGFNTAITGWHHPYCRILGNDLSDCAWANGGWTNLFVERYLRHKSLAERARYLAKWQSRFVPFMGEPPHLVAPEGLLLFRENSIAALQYLLTNANRMLRNQNLNLLFLHFPVPHPPGIWDTSKETYTTVRSNYIDNLQLADNILGQIRRELEGMGDWDRSTVLVSSDHSYRTLSWEKFAQIRTVEMVKETAMKRYPYVPFFLKLPGQHQAVNYDREFNNALTSDLILQLLNEKLPATKDAVAWLDAHANLSEAE
jgi:hypothetical protein